MEVKVLQSENDVYQKERLLGQGAFGKAYLVRKKQTGELLVIKQVNIEQMTKQQREQTIKQAQILRSLRHPLIVRFVEVYATKNNKLKIVMQYAECGDLSKSIVSKKNQKQFFDENQILDWFTQICLAMKHVHDRKILHRDIKGQNIFITKNNTLKLGDFGIARVLNKTMDKARTVVGTPYYLSPEIIENKPYSFKSDIWSMGVLLYELCALTPPFTANSLQFLALKIVKGSYAPLPGNYSKELKGIIQQVLQVDPMKRPSVGDILNKPIIQERIRKYLSETYRKEEFSHTLIYKMGIANKLVKVQDDKKVQNQKLKQKEQALLRERLEKKREEERLKEEERLRRKREEEQQRKEEEQRRAVQERKLRMEKDKRRQQEEKRNFLQQQRRRVLQIAEMARQRQKLQNQLSYNRRQPAINDKYQSQKNRPRIQSQKKQQKEQEQLRKMEEFNEFARKQWLQNQMIKKRAEERARQAEMEQYTDPSTIEQQAKPLERYQSIKDHSNRTPSTPNNSSNAKPKQPQSKTPAVSHSVKKKQKDQLQVQPRLEIKPKNNYSHDRQQIRKDRQEHLKQPKNTINQDYILEETPPNKKQAKPIEKEQKPAVQSPPTANSDTLMKSSDLYLKIKDEQQFKDYLSELEGLLGNVNKNISKFQVLPELPVVEQEIILREDDAGLLDYSMTGSFENIQPKQQVDATNADFDYFSNYSKLEDLRMGLEDTFGTDNFVRIYRTLQEQLQLKGLQGFNILSVMSHLGKGFDAKLITQNLSLLLTLIIMEEKLSRE